MAGTAGLAAEVADRVIALVPSKNARYARNCQSLGDVVGVEIAWRSCSGSLDNERGPARAGLHRVAFDDVVLVRAVVDIKDVFAARSHERTEEVVRNNIRDSTFQLDEPGHASVELAVGDVVAVREVEQNSSVALVKGAPSDEVIRLLELNRDAHHSG